MSLVPHYSDDEYDDNADIETQDQDGDDGHHHVNVNLPYFANQQDPEDSTSDDDDDVQDQQSTIQKGNSNAGLKNPFRTLDEPKNVEKEESVFHLPFKDEEDQKVKALERHIKMTTRTDQLSTINDKKICWNFRKGRCRFGHSCVFAHDSDLQEKKTAAAAEGGGVQDKNEDDQKSHKESDKLAKFFGKNSSSFFGQDLNQSEGTTSSLQRQDNDKSEEDQQTIRTTMIGQPQYIDNVEKIMEMKKSGKRKRPGLSQGLVPGKKVMKDYFKQQQKKA